ncbi:MAG: hydrogenase expression/formation protein HypE [Peptococcaceae bacterium]|nr:hydrogenase expression/formation protein HypE [Peptococcaceae bacterium]
MSEIITLSHGSGGILTHRLIDSIFMKNFANDIINAEDDSARLDIASGRIAFTTDSFVVSPVFFKGGDIGKLAVCGTVNDLVAGGAVPLYLSCGFILEEGLEMRELERIAESMAQTARECGVKIVAGDTKVVQKGAADKVYINTSGIGLIHKAANVSGAFARPGDKVIVTGTIGDHGSAIFLEREKLSITTDLKSDCAPLNQMMERIFDNIADLHALRDPTRGGLATALNEIAGQSDVGIVLKEPDIPVRDEVIGICELLGLDPLYMANEGKMVIIVPETSANAVLDLLTAHEYGRDARIIGEVVGTHKKKVVLKTVTGGHRVVDMLSGDILPRIC